MGSVGETASFDTGSSVPLWLDGKQVSGAHTFDVVSPVTGKTLYRSAAASEEDALAAVKAAEKALPSWSQTKTSERRKIFLDVASELERKREIFWKFAHEETAVTESYFDFDFSGAINGLRSVAGLMTTIQGTVPEVAQPGRSAMLVREPFGVVLAISPWNAPNILGLRSFLAPIAMGNTVVLKGPEKAPGCLWALLDVFHAVGLPPGVVNTIIHRPEDGRIITPALIKAPAVRKINFTGSTAVGSIVAKLAGEYLKPVLLELGGKAPAIICEDADLQLAAAQCAVGAFLHAGQICMSTERVIVNQKIADQFRDAFKDAIDTVFPAKTDPILVEQPPVGRIRDLLRDALKKGARTIYGDAEHTLQLPTAMRPVVLEGIKPDMDIYYKESFGPTVSLIVVQDDEEALRVANDTEYGLAAAVFTQDLRRGLKIARGIETGAVHINAMSVHDEPSLPHGGVKSSGYGRFNDVEGLREWVRWKTITWMD